jgi:LacI family transcriptional regulator
MKPYADIISRMALIHCHLGPLTHLERGVLDGLLRCAAGHGWDVAVEAWTEIPEGTERDADAHLVRGNHPRLERLRATGRPVVAIGCDLPFSLPQVWLDDRAIGAAAAHHLIDRGFRLLGYRGDPGIPTSVRRRAGFIEAAGAAGVAGLDLEAAPALLQRWSHAGELADTRRLLAELERPLGILAFTCHVGRRVLSALAGSEPPHRLAVVAGDHDPQVAMASRPVLACVRTAPERLGFTAGEVIAGLLAGRPAPTAPILLPPAGVDDGASAAMRAVTDPAVLAALAHAERDAEADVDALAAAAGVARRTLEMRFRASLGEAPARLLRRRRMNRALGLLADGSQPVAEVATACGWASATRFSADVRAATGMPPLAWRRMAQRGGLV